MDEFKYVNSVNNLMRFLVKGIFENGGNIAIDATLGRGNDAIFLSSLFKKVYAMDIQKEAVLEFENFINQEDNPIKNIEVRLMSHADIDDIDEEVDLIVYNLGYLPGANKDITTNAKSTIESLRKAVKMIKKGFIIIALYSGHEEGKIEAESVISFVSGLNTKEYAVMHHTYINRGNNPPSLIVIEKRTI